MPAGAGSMLTKHGREPSWHAGPCREPARPSREPSMPPWLSSHASPERKRREDRQAPAPQPLPTAPAPTPSAETLVRITDAAAGKLRELTAAEANPNIGLRVYVYSGGCSGFRYGVVL